MLVRARMDRRWRQQPEVAWQGAKVDITQALQTLRPARKQPMMALWSQYAPSRAASPAHRPRGVGQLQEAARAAKALHVVHGHADPAAGGQQASG